MQKLQRVSVFRRAENEKGYVQAVIHAEDMAYFSALGFAPSVDQMPVLEGPTVETQPEPENQPEPEPRPKARKRNASEGDSEE